MYKGYILGQDTFLCSLQLFPVPVGCPSMQPAVNTCLAFTDNTTLLYIQCWIWIFLGPEFILSRLQRDLHIVQIHVHTYTYTYTYTHTHKYTCTYKYVVQIHIFTYTYIVHCTLYIIHQLNTSYMIYRTIVLGCIKL